MTPKPRSADPAEDAAAPPPLPPAETVHLRFLDGVRALAALYVVLFHLVTVVPQEGLSYGLRAAEVFFSQGHLAVGVFIVLSGYVLMLPVVRSKDGRLRGGFREYIRRRGQRILIPYYAAFLLSIPSDLYRQRVHHEAFSWPSLAAHLFLIHDLRQDWKLDFNPVLWSVAVEWQIYFVFALALVPVWRRWGIAAATGLAFFLGSFSLCLPYSLGFSWACPWYIALFGLGNLAAYLSMAPSPAVRAAGRIPWGTLAIAAFAALLLSLNFPLPFSYPLDDYLIGFMFFCYILHAIVLLRRYPAESKRLTAWPWQRRFVEWLGAPALVALSAFSYSLYLVHFPLLSTLDTLLKKRIHSSDILFVTQILVVLPICLAAAYLFSQLFEKPFTSSRSRQPKPSVSGTGPEKDQSAAN